MRLVDKVAMVSGSGRGIGRAIALKLASEGASVLVNDLDEDVAKAAAAEITDAGGRSAYIAGDVTEADFGDRFVKAAVDAFGTIDIIVNNAGYAWDGVIQKTVDEQWAAMIDVHLSAPFRILRAAQPVLAAAAKAEIAENGIAMRRAVVNISSVAGLGGNVGQSGYAAGKAGIVGLTKTLAKEWGRHNITVNAVAFGAINTRMTSGEIGSSTINVKGREIRAGMSKEMIEDINKSIPLGRMGTPDEAAGAVTLLCLPESAYISGEVVTVGGGWHL